MTPILRFRSLRNLLLLVLTGSLLASCDPPAHQGHASRPRTKHVHARHVHNAVHLHPGYDPVAGLYRAHNESTNDWYVWMVASDGGGYTPASAPARASGSSGGTFSLSSTGPASGGGVFVASDARAASVAPVASTGGYQSSVGGWSNPNVTSVPTAAAVSPGDLALGVKMGQSDPAPPLPSGGRWEKTEPPENPEKVEEEMEPIEEVPAEVVIVTNAAGQEEDEAQVAEEDTMDATAEAQDADANAADDAAAASESAGESAGGESSGDSGGGDGGGGDGGGGD